MEDSGGIVMTDGLVEEAAKLFSVLSEPTRLKIIRILMEGALTVGELVEKLDLKQGSVSKQLGILHESGLLSRERDGNFIRYQIGDPIVEHLCKLVCGRVERVTREKARAMGISLD